MKLEVINAAAKEETEEYNCTDMMWGVFKAYAFFLLLFFPVFEKVKMVTLMFGHSWNGIGSGLV